MRKGEEASSKDIAERVRVEQALGRSHRALNMLSRCNKTLVRATDERRFMQEICELAVEHSGYLLAWIGMRDEPSGPGVTSVASAGRDEGYTENARDSWDETDRGSGPISRAIRTGRPVVVQSIAADPEFEPWREEALKREFVDINRAGCESVGLPREQIIGRKCYDLVHWSQSPIVACPCTNAGQTLEPAVSEHEERGRSYELLAWPLLGPGRRMDGFVHVVKDITDRKRAEKEREERIWSRSTWPANGRRP